MVNAHPTAPGLGSNMPRLPHNHVKVPVFRLRVFSNISQNVVAFSQLFDLSVQYINIMTERLKSIVSQIVPSATGLSAM